MRTVNGRAASTSARRPRAGAAVSLFSGAGGLDLGLETAGWQVLAQIEMNEDCVGTLQNHARHAKRETSILQKRIEEVDPRQLRSSLGLKRGELDLLAGGPPCQPFTTTGLRRAIKDRRAATAFPTYLEFVKDFLPRALLVENVDGMLSVALSHRPLAERHGPLSGPQRKGTFLQWLLNQLVELGYCISWGVIESADYGVPQRRQRAVLLGVRGGDPCFLPEPTHGGPGLPRVRTLRDAIRSIQTGSPIQPLSERKCRVFQLIPPGGNWRSLPESVRRETMGAAFKAEGGKSGWWRRLSWDAPAPTILGMPDHSSTGLIHPDETRCLSVAECASLQSFPRWARFFGKPRSQYQQIGNAVPPLVGEALGVALAAHLAGERRPVPPIPDWRRTSANRRIGTHGWVIPRKEGPSFHLHVRVRGDHVWSSRKGRRSDHAGEQQH